MPFIAHWPGKIREGIISDETAMTFDLLPTFLNQANAEYKSQLDGVDLSTHLFQKEDLPARTLFWKMDDEIAVRKGDWKLVQLGDQPAELYNLRQDLSETKDVSQKETEITQALYNSYLSWVKEMNF